ncbi:MAG: HPr family phosphocarrier protein [Deltaproteobacteria bacterium]|nr:HPr family phosphocarrier protein [Deltaproteobacteria bacterium]
MNEPKNVAKSARVEGTVELDANEDLHVRPATLIAQCAQKFTSSISIVRDSDEVNGKSAMELLMLAAGSGTNLIIRAEGPDAEEAVAALVALVERGFRDP